MGRKLTYRRSKVLGGEPLEDRRLLAAVIYDDALQGTWGNWSWDSQVNLTQTNVVLAGSQAIATQVTRGWGALYLGNNVGVAATPRDEIEFAIHGGNSAQRIRFFVVDGNDQWILGADLANLSAQWTTITIDCEDLGNPARIKGLVWQESTGAPRVPFFVDQVRVDDLVPDDPQEPLPGPTIQVTADIGQRSINPDIYGMNYADPQLATEIALPVHRWGGNATTRYNFQLDVANRASDFFFENIPEDNSDISQLPRGSSADRFVQANQQRNANSIMTVGMIGWTPKSRDIQGAFPVNLYGPQQATNPYRPEHGNGVRLDGTLITGNDPTLTSRPVDARFAAEWVQHLVGQFGTADAGGVAYYALDNEPMLWNSTHRDVHPQPATYDEVWQKGVEYATAIKGVDPQAQILGPTVWGWTAYFYSALDAAGPGAWWENPIDRNAHGGLAFLPWYLSQMRQAEVDGGKRLLDYLDIHYYPQSPGVALSSAGDMAIQQERVRSTRSLWDPNYVDASWINDRIQLIPRMRSWIDQYYPGTKLAITEYNWGGLESANGAVTQADVLGIFGREGVDLATLWASPDADDPGSYAFRMYRNYDGRNQPDSRFGDISLGALSSDSDRVSVFAARRTADQALTLMLVNKSPDPWITPLRMESSVSYSKSERYVYDLSRANQILREADLTLGDGVVSLTLPGYSITLLELSPDRLLADLNRDGSVDAADAALMFSNWGSAGPGDLDRDGLIDAADAAELFAQWTGDAPGAFQGADAHWPILNLRAAWRGPRHARRGGLVDRVPRDTLNPAPLAPAKFVDACFSTLTLPRSPSFSR